MIFILLVIFGFLSSVSTREIRADKEFYVDDDFTGMDMKTINGRADVNLLNKMNPKESVVDIEASHHIVDRGSVADKLRKSLSGRNSGNKFPSVNASLEYSPGKENGTWNVEKKEKTLDLGKEVIKTCQMTTQELVATAQATVTRALKGLCNSKEMEERFENMENSIINQLNLIKQMILNLEDRLEEHEDAVNYGQKQISAAIFKGFAGTLNENGGIPTPPTDFSNKNPKPSHDYFGTKISAVSAAQDGSDEDVSITRDPEILKFNSSIHMETSLSGPPRKVFTYYWKIQDMMFKLTGWNPRKSLRSQSFYIFPSGYRMYMRIYPRLNGENFYVRVGLTKGEFDDALKWPFPLKHKIHILDQTKEGRLFEDIASRIWDPNLLCSDFNWQKPIKGDNHECVEIGFPHDVLKQREYIRKDALVIKLTVYLES